LQKKKKEIKYKFKGTGLYVYNTHIFTHRAVVIVW